MPDQTPAVAQSPLTLDRIRKFWIDLNALVAERSATEERLLRERANQSGEIERAHIEARKRLTTWQKNELQTAEADFAVATGEATAILDAKLRELKAVHARAREEANERYQTDEETVNQAYKETRWTHDAVHEANVKRVRAVRDRANREFSERQQTAASIKSAALERHRLWNLTPAAAKNPTGSPSTDGDSHHRIDELLATANDQLKRFERMIAPRWLMGDRLLWACFALWCAIAACGIWLPAWYYGLILATVVAPIVGVAARFFLSSRARSRSVRIGQPLFEAVAEAERLCGAGDFAAEDQYKRAVADSARRQRDDIRRAEIDHRKALAEALETRDRLLAEAESKWNAASGELDGLRSTTLGAINDRRRETVEAIETRVANDSQSLESEHQTASTGHKQRFDSAESDLVQRWEAGRTRLQGELAAIGSENDRLFPAWFELMDASSPDSAPPSLRIGSMAVNLPAIPGGKPDAFGMTPFDPERFSLPALLPFPQKASTLLHATDASRQATVAALQSIMLRFLTATPPGKVRFTIVDPVGLGENFATFMHLADHDEQLVGGRIWTEPAQIERRLTDLTAHMENVIQKYLRNQYKSIEEYNAQAGEVAEPYRVLVVANFPTNFSADMARRLVSIASSGANCGVFVLVGTDVRAAMPQGFSIDDLASACINLSWSNGQFAWEDADFGPLPLTLDSPPEPAVLARIVQQVGERAKLAGRVEVDFGFIEPARERWWSASSKDGVRVPLGRAGATKRQFLHLGVGTAQHVLVAGKTGSGKSTLLHALVTNLALHFGPEELELYLIDFKKGVEFKTYAAHRLPHARVIAVESEREFGLSVLQRLDAELKRRGELFRVAGVQDLASYRDRSARNGTTAPAEPMPRILLIVDEFQEFFVEDDKLSQEAALLLDRLVRQGRAFGLHVLLGSQTLGGAYSLARSTIDQMAVRIALQCSEADANLILAKDNNAARLLSRPGEAIYNDANGLVEGNDIFQVVWLPESRREAYLRDLHDMAEKRGWRAPAPTIVFEGNNPAELSGNPRLLRLIEAGPLERGNRERRAWLGDALAIKDPTSAVFRRQSGSNLLIIGQNADVARSICVSAAISLLFQEPPQERVELPLITLLDGSPADDPDAERLPRLAKLFPDDIAVVNWRDPQSAFQPIMAELERRKSEPNSSLTPRFLFVYGLHRFRDLRRSEDDFGFGRKNEGGTAAPAEQFAELLREGPALGLHIVAWCDTLANVQRSLDRRDIREFEQRVLFQMGVTDSSTLIDSPAASRLGLNRALFAAEELSSPEKFRPYGLPTETWVAEQAAKWNRKKSECPA